MSEQRDELSHRAHRAHQQCLFAAKCESKALNKNLLCLVAHHSLPPFSPQLRVPLHTVIPAMPHNSALRQTNATTQSARAILKKKISTDHLWMRLAAETLTACAAALFWPS
jgi:hypothetical protein